MIKKLSIALLLLALGVVLVSCKPPLSPKTDKGMPTVTQKELEMLFAEDTTFHTRGDGATIAIKSHKRENENKAITGSNPEEIWNGNDGSTNNFTLPEQVAFADGSLGTLQIPKIGLTVGVYETDDAVESMKHGAAHLKETSAWDGNIGLAAHNRGVNTYFGQIHTLNTGDLIYYTTAQGNRTYTVDSIKTIDQMDWSSLGRTEDNRITLVTCIDSQPTQRLIVQAIEVPSTPIASVAE